MWNKVLLLIVVMAAFPVAVNAKSCKQYRSCAEVIADYPSGNFGRKDRDGDGIPCENVCQSREQVKRLLEELNGNQEDGQPKN